MKPSYLQPAARGTDRWTVSYTDVLTILLIFFLVAAAKTVANPIVPKVPAPPQPFLAPVVPEPVRADLLRVRDRFQSSGLDTRLEARGLVISLPQTILFRSGEDRVSAEALPALEQVADVLRDIPNGVRLIGYADLVPIHNRRFRSNWELSMARSLRILEVLNAQFGIDESRLSIASYGPYRPAASNDTADGRASNRRVEIIILDDPAKS
jgi:chemotaxis protein MotB